MENVPEDLRIVMSRRGQELPEVRAKGIFDKVIFPAAPVIDILGGERLAIGSNRVKILGGEEAEMFAHETPTKRRREVGDLVLCGISGWQKGTVPACHSSWMGASWCLR